MPSMSEQGYSSRFTARGAGEKEEITQTSSLNQTQDYPLIAARSYCTLPASVTTSNYPYNATSHPGYYPTDRYPGQQYSAPFPQPYSTWNPPSLPTFWPAYGSQYRDSYYSTAEPLSPPDITLTPATYDVPIVSDGIRNQNSSEKEKRFICDRHKECKAAFVRKVDLARHIDCVHVKTPQFSCPIKNCSRKRNSGFTRRDHRTEHLRHYHHRVIPKRPRDSQYVDEDDEEDSDHEIRYKTKEIALPQTLPSVPGDSILSQKPKNPVDHQIVDRKADISPLTPRPRSDLYETKEDALLTAYPSEPKDSNVIPKQRSPAGERIVNNKADVDLRPSKLLSALCQFFSRVSVRPDKRGTISR